MSAPKKHTEFIFEAIKDPESRRYYGVIALQYDIYKSIADRRKELGMTQHDLAKNSLLRQSLIAKIEAGRSNPTISTLVILAVALKMRLSLVKEDWIDDEEYNRRRVWLEDGIMD